MASRRKRRSKEEIAADKAAELAAIKESEEIAAAEAAALAAKEPAPEVKEVEVVEVPKPGFRRNTTFMTVEHSTCRFKEKRGRKRGRW